MATTQLLDGSIRICKVLIPNPRTEWQLEVTGKDGHTVTLGLDFPLREFLHEVLKLYPNDLPKPRPFEFFDDNCEEDLGDVGHPDNCRCIDCEAYYDR